MSLGGTPSPRLDRVNCQNPCYLAVWAFQVKPHSQLAFEKIYGWDGEWALLFRQSPDYLGTRLFRDLDRPGCYLTFDYWTTREALHQFKEAHRSFYDALDQQCEVLTDNEESLGEFESLSPVAE